MWARSRRSPLRVFVLTLGTRGDFELFLALARALRRRGHEVVVGSSPFYAAATGAAGVEWVPIGRGTYDELVTLLRSLASVRDRMKRTQGYYHGWLRPQLAQGMSDITSTAAASDYFISNLKMVMQRDGSILPGAAVTYDPPASFADLARYGTQNHAGRILDLVAMPKALVDPDNCWEPAYRFTGFWSEAPSGDGTPSDELVDFVQAGAPPVVVTMGSMVMFDEDRLVRHVGDALRRCGARAVVVGGWSGIAAGGALGEGLFGVREAPYAWLFPRASCVIHHGGCGTVASVLRAGKPSILLPQISAQEDFGRILARHGLTTGVFQMHSLRPGDLADAIDAAGDAAVQARAREWQAVVSAERGVAAAAEHIDTHAAELVG